MLKVLNKTSPKSTPLKIEQVTITPEIARAWLDKNKNNRKLSKRSVDAGGIGGRR